MKDRLLLRAAMSAFLILLLYNCGLWELDGIEFFQVTTGEPENITKSTAEITASLSNLRNATLEDQGFCWSSTHNNPTLSENEGALSVPSGSGPVFRITLSNLAVRTVYYVAAYAVIDGKTFYGDVQTFVTEGIQILTDENVELERDVAFVSGSLVGIDQEIFVIDHGHYYSTQKGFEPKTGKKVSLGEKREDGVFTSKLTGLENNTTYYVRSFLVTNDGAIFYGDEISFFVALLWERKADFPGLFRLDAVTFTVGEEAFFGLGRLPGIGPDSHFDDFWKYDSRSDTWHELKNYEGGKRSNAAAFTIDGQGYVGTGEDQNGNEKADIWRYNADQDDWIREADYLAPVTTATGLTLDNMGYIVLGSNFIPGFGYVRYIDVFYYDHVGKSWEWVADLPVEAIDDTASAFYFFQADGKVYYRSNKNRTLWEADPATGEITAKTQFAYDVHTDPIYFAIGTKIYFGGGVVLVNGENVALTEFWEFDVRTEEWKKLPDLDFSTGALLGAHSFAVNGHGYVILFNGTDNFWKFTPPQ